MIDKTKIISSVLTRLKRLPIKHYLDLRTYKRNRSILIVKQSEADYLIVENGFEQGEFTVSLDKLEKTLKGLLKKEFPRSHKIRLYTMGEFKENEGESNRKII